VVKALTEYVLVKLEPLKRDADKELAKRFGVTEFPALLLLDPTGERKLGAVGDEPPEKVAAALREALGR
jgi:thioredoxin-related protein